MKKHIYFFMLFVATISLHANGQCSKTYSNTGVYPTQLDDAYETIPYSFEVDFTFPTDTTISSQNIHIDSVSLSNCTGFPAGGFSYNCGNGTCRYSAGTGGKYQGCIMISGTPAKGSAGTYALKVTLTAYFSIFGSPQSYSLDDTTAHLRVLTCNLMASTPVAANTAICPGGSSSLWADSGNYSYVWLKGGVATGDTTRSITVNDSSRYSFILKDKAGCTDTSAEGMVAIYAQPLKPTISVSGMAATASPAGMHYVWYKSPLWDSLSLDSSVVYCASLPAQYKGALMVKYKDNNGCWSNRSDSASLDCFVGISNPLLTKNFTVFPNPASEQAWLIIQSKTALPATLNLMDATGKTVHTQQLTLAAGNNYHSIPLHGLRKGIYFIRLHQADTQASSTLLVE